MGIGHQSPFSIHILKPSQPEVIQASGTFNVARHRLNHRVVHTVDHLASSAIQPMKHS